MSLFNQKPRYYCLFLRAEQDSYRLIKRKRFKPKKKNLQFQGLQLIICNESGKNFLNITKYNFRKGNKLYYYIDINTGQLFFYENINQQDYSLVIDSIEKRHIIKQFTSGLMDTSFKGNIVWIILGIIMGIGIVFTIMYFM